MRDVHVFRDAGERRWMVASRGRTLSCYRTQATAIVAGIRVASPLRVDVVTHGCNGRIRSKDSYGNESPRPDREH